MKTNNLQGLTDVEVFYNHQAQTTPFPVHIAVDRAEGIYIYDTAGKRYTDLVSGIGVSSLGHGQPKVIEAIKAQAEKYLHVMVYGEFSQAPQVALSKLLLNQLPQQLNSIYLVNSGTEANEAALKLAKRVTGRTKLVAFKKAYHGSTHGSLSVTGNEQKKYAFRPLLPDVHFITLNNYPDLEQIDTKTAGVILETIQGDAGVRIPETAYLVALKKRCEEVGALLILDEIQCGMGRTGKLFAFEHYPIVPDVLTLGKAFGGGMPIGALIASRAHMNTFTFDPMLGHITTFGGHPVVCAAGHAALEILLENDYIQQAEAKGKLFVELLGKHPLIKEIRQIGLMLAIDTESEAILSQLIGNLLEKGIILFRFLSHPYSFRIAPPLTITEAEIKESCAVILTEMNRLQATA